MQQALVPHRRLTHSLFTILTIAVIGLVPWRTGWSPSVGGGLFGIAIGMLLHVALDLPYEAGASPLWPLAPEKLRLFWSLPGIWAYLDQTMNFLFAPIFLYVLHALARKYQVRERLLIPAAIAAVIAFAAMVAYDSTGPASDQWLLVYTAVGVPFLVLILVLPRMNSRTPYSIAN